MRWSLRYQILIPFTLVLLGAIVSVSALNAILATHQAKRQIEQQLKGIAATLSESSFPLTDAVLRQMHGLSGAEFLFTDEQGRELAASSHVELPPHEPPLVVSKWQELQLGPPMVIDGERYFCMVLAMKGRGQQQPGLLRIFYPERFWQEARSEAIVSPLLVGAIALGTTALLALILAGRLMRPILELRQQVNRIAQADYAPMPLPHRNDELRDLASAVNLLAGQLSEMERAIRRSERLALVGQLAGGLAHHLRNSVTGARMAVQLHARECDGDRESLQVALRQLTLTEENLKQFLAAPHSIATPLHRAECSLADVVREVVDLVGPSLRHRRVELSVIDDSSQRDRGTDGGAANYNNHPLAIQADAAQLRQMLINIVLNAAEAAGPGGFVKILQSYNRSNASDESHAPHIVLRVLDNGPGPAPEIAARLFEPFVTSKSEGIGLGLAVSQQIVQSHGGQIFLTRVNGETCVEVHLPLSRENNSKLEDAPRAPATEDVADTPQPHVTSHR